MDDKNLARLRAADPAHTSDLEGLDPAVLHRLREHTLASPPRQPSLPVRGTAVGILDELMKSPGHVAPGADSGSSPAAVPPRSRRTGRGPRQFALTALTALAGAAAVTVAALVLPLGGSPQASAAEVLLVTAESAGQQPDLTAGASHWYVGTKADAPDTEPFTSEVWYSRDEPTLLRDGAVAAGYLNGGVKDPTKVRTEELTNSEGDEQTSSTWYIGDERLTWDGLEALPTDPDELDALMRREVADHPTGEDDALWSTITNLMRSPASPALRQALWEVAAHIPDVELVGPMTDAVGREGVAIERDQTDEDWYNQIFIVDPNTGALLERRDVAADGTTDYRETELVSEPTDTLPEPDPPLCGADSEPEVSC